MGLTDSLSGLIQENPIASTLIAGAAGAVVGGAVVAGATALSSSKKKSSKRKKITHTKRGWKQDRARYNKSQKWEVAYRKRKRKKSKKTKRKGSKTSRRGKVKYTKNGQPYIILKSGKARFIKGRRR